MSPQWNRRTFLATAGLTAAVAASPRLFAESNTASLFCIATEEHIQLFHALGATFTPFGTPTACEAPRSPILHPTRNVLYVAHSSREYLNLPRASISAWAINPVSGALRQLHRIPLTLSATHPQHLAVSYDGRTLLVSATGGGAYNIFALAPDGSILPGAHALKQTGRGPHPLQYSAQPTCAVFHPTLPIAYGCDFGADRVDQLDLSTDVPTIVNRTSLSPGSGPSHIAFDPVGHQLIVTSNLELTRHIIAVERNSGHLSPSARRISIATST